MESTSASATTRTSRHTDLERRFAHLALALLLAVFALMLVFKMDAVAGGADSSGYLNHAKQLAAGHIHEPMRIVGDVRPSSDPTVSSYLYVPLGYRPSGAEQMAPTYPVGVSLLLAAIAAVVGWDAAPGITTGLHAIAGLLLFYTLARALRLSRGWALIGVLLAALCPLYLMYSLQVMSDLPSFTWCAATILFAWKSRERAAFAVAAGASLALSVLIRPTNVLLFLPVAVALGFSWRRWLLLGVAGLPGAIFWAMYNRAAYGHPFASGYGNIFEIMAWSYGPQTLLNYLRWLPATLTPLAVLLLAFPRLLISTPRIGWMLLLWWAGFATFYAFYYCTHETWWYLRFILPAFPAFILTILFVGSQMADRYRAVPFGFDNKRSWIVTFVLLGTIISSGIYWNRKLHTLNQRDRIHYRDACTWARENLPSNSIVFAMQTSGAFFYYTDLTVVRWDAGSVEDLRKIEDAARITGQPIYAATFPFEMEPAEGNSLINKLPGWEKLVLIGQTTVWKRINATTHD